MFNTNGGYSLADIAAATGGSSNRDSGGWGDEGGAWWIIILFLFVFCGWGNNGNGWGGNSGGGSSAGQALTRGELCQDMNFADVEQGIRGISDNLTGGFAGVQSALASEFRGTDNAICTLGYQMQTGFNDVITAANANATSLTSQLSSMAAQNASCCCDIEREVERDFADLNYNLATQSCATQRTISDTARDLLDNQNANTRSILDFLTQDKLATLTAENQGLRLAASQQAQNNYLVNALKPSPVPAFTVPNPYTGYATPYAPCGC